MNQLSIDFETYSEADIRKLGSWAYSMHPTTEVLCMAYAVNDNDPVLWLPGEDLSEFTELVFGQNSKICAWNSFFEYSIWTNVLKWRSIPFKFWEDTAALALAAGLPRKLETCGEVLQLAQDKAKSKRGSYLIQRLCKPYRGKRNRNPELLEELYDYCRQDVVAERTISKMLPKLSPFERELWELDQTINARGFLIDTDQVKTCIELKDKTELDLNMEAFTLTEGALDDVGKRQKVLDYIRGVHDYPLKSYDKATIVETLKDPDLPTIPRRLLEIRQQTGKTSVAKYVSLERLTEHDSRVRGAFSYHAAGPGRWSGSLFQPQNLPRATVDDVETCIATVKTGDTDLITALYGDTMDALSNCVRGAIIAGEGNRLIVADFSQIEARVLAWLAGQHDILDAFRNNVDIYEHAASKIYRKPLDEITKDERFNGKVATLSLGYQGSEVALLGMAKNYGIDLDPDLATEIKTGWRESNDRIVALWYALQSAAIKAFSHPGTITQVGKIRFVRKKSTLFMILPSGRKIFYNAPGLEENRFGKDGLFYRGINSVTRKWEKIHIYGGMWTENACQAIARDLLAAAIIRLENAGYRIVLHVHDEVVIEVDKTFGSEEKVHRIMCHLPTWAKGLPVDAEAFECERYTK